MAGRANSPAALRSSDTFQIACSQVNAAGGSGRTPNVSNSQIGIQKTREYAPQGAKSCGSCQSSKVSKNRTRHTPSVNAGPGSNQKRFQRSITAFTTAFTAQPRRAGGDDPGGRRWRR